MRDPWQATERVFVDVCPRPAAPHRFSSAPTYQDPRQVRIGLSGGANSRPGYHPALTAACKQRPGPCEMPY